MALDPNTVILQAVSFDKKVLGTTTYLVEVGVTHKDEQQYYQKLLRFKDLEALDTILSQKFKNLKFP